MTLKLKIKSMRIENLDEEQYIDLEYQYDTQWYTTYTLHWRNSSFRWKSNICFSNDEFSKFKTEIKILDIWIGVNIQDNDSDAYIEIIKVNDLWHFLVNYQI